MPSFNDFYFNSSTGKNRIHVRRCVPDGQVRAVVQIMHGIAEHISRYDDFMAFLASNGFVAVGTDHLGHGQSIEKPEQMGFFAEKTTLNQRFLRSCRGRGSSYFQFFCELLRKDLQKSWI